MTTDSDPFSKSWRPAGAGMGKSDLTRVLGTQEEIHAGRLAEHLNCAAWLASHPEWAPVPGFSRYEVSHRGGGIRRRGGGRQPLKVSVGTHGYPEAQPYNDQGKQEKPTMHSLVLLGHAGPPPDGTETLHGKGGPLDYRYCGCGSPGCTEGNLRYDTHKVNVGETIAAGNARRPATVPCVNHDRCGGLVVNAGSRCLPCAEDIGVTAAAMLGAGMASDAVTRVLGYKSESWVLTLARRHGGYEGAPPRHQSWPKHVAAAVRYRLKIRKGDGK